MRQVHIYCTIMKCLVAPPICFCSLVSLSLTDAAEIQRKSFEMGLQIGSNRRIRDIINWAKRRRRHIRRDDLIAYLCGKPPPKSQRHSPPRSRVGSRSLSERGSPISAGSLAQDRDPEPDLTAFQNALAIQGTLVMFLVE